MAFSFKLYDDRYPLLALTFKCPISHVCYFVLMVWLLHYLYSLHSDFYTSENIISIETPYNRLSGQQMLSGTQIISKSHRMTGRNFFDVFLPFYLLFGFLIYVRFVALQMRNLHTKNDSIGFNI